MDPVELAPPHWLEIARPDQLPPEGDWLVWAFIAGRGAGKTRAMAEWVIDSVRRGGKRRFALISRTPGDVREVMIEGESGILACSPIDFRPTWNPSVRRLTWPNGAIATTYSSENPEQLRGPQHDGAWADEPAAWDDAKRGDVLGTSWNNMMLGLRLGEHPQCGFSTTPKNTRLVREVLKKSSTVITRASTYDNLSNLAPTFREQVLAAYEGTRIGRQELMGELLTDVEGALVSVEMLDASRLMTMPDVYMTRVVVAVDPATTSGEDSDETGIVVCAKGQDGRGYVLADVSCKASPDGWARRVANVYEQYAADRVVAEKNRGGDMVETIVRSVYPNISYKGISARIGKRLRAEPVAALYEQGRISHVGSFPALEDQLTSWVPDSTDSPDRLDALVHGFTELGLVSGGNGGREWLESMAKTCVSCSMPNPLDATKCSKCGADLPFSESKSAEPEEFSLTSGGVDGPVQYQLDPNQAVRDTIATLGPQQWSPFNRQPWQR